MVEEAVPCPNRSKVPVPEPPPLLPAPVSPLPAPPQPPPVPSPAERGDIGGEEMGELNEEEEEFEKLLERRWR